jgi:hypothetical protein
MPSGVYPRGPVSEETRRRISLKNTGRKHTAESRLHMSESHRGHKFPVHGLAKAIAINTGKPCSPETRKKIREHHKIFFNQESVRREISERQRGEKGPGWKDGRTPINKRLRTSIEYKLWREAVFARDNWTCQECGKRGSTILHPHHIKPFADFPELRFSIDNGLTLCLLCHREVHRSMKLGDKKYA